MDTPQPRTSVFASVLGPGAFLASSWTWCIGMFLPLLLMRDYGPWAYLAFAVPNCLGAGLLGRVLRGRDIPRILQSHSGAVNLFGTVTMAFQWFFLVWMCGDLPVLVLPLVLGACVLGLCLAVSWRRSDRAAGVGGSLALVLSLVAAGVWLWLSRGRELPPTLPPARPLGELGALAAVCVLGFGLCPYLDRTFLLTAERAGPAKAPAVFAVGFLVLFPLLIQITHLAWPVLGAGVLQPGAFPMLLALHVGLQLGFTIAAHDRAIPASHRPGVTWQGGVAGAVGVAIAVVARLAPGAVHGLPPAEVAYRGFMSFYGLIFPAYVWVCMIPGGWITVPPRRALFACLAGVALASPFFYLGMMMRDSWWLIPGISMVLASRWLMPGGSFARLASA